MTDDNQTSQSGNQSQESPAPQTSSPEPVNLPRPNDGEAVTKGG